MKACESNSVKLSALADGELTGWAVWRLRRHVASCATCARELEDWKALSLTLRAADFLPNTAVNETPEFVTVVTTRSPRRRLLVPALVGVAAVAGVGVLIGFVPGQPGNPKPAYAEVSLAMQKIRTAQWVETISNFDRRTGAKQGELITTVYEQIDPLRIARRGHSQQEANSWSGQGDYDVSSSITADEARDYDGSIGDIVVRKLTNTRKKPSLFLDQLSGLAVIQRESNAPKKPGRTVTTEHTTLNGHPALLLTVKAPIFANGQDRFEYRLWADEVSKRVLRTDDRIFSAPDNRMTTHVTTDDYRYDEPIDESLFTLAAPAGAPVYKDGNSSVQLSASERAQIAHLVAETYRGLEQGDWQRFSAGWDFDFAASLPHSAVAPGQQEAVLRQRVEASRGDYQTYDGKVLGIYHATSTKIMGYGEAKLPAGNPPLLSVVVMARVLYKDGFNNGGTERFYLRRDGTKGFRIVGWQIAFPETRDADRKRWLKNGRKG